MFLCASDESFRSAEPVMTLEVSQVAVVVAMISALYGQESSALWAGEFSTMARRVQHYGQESSVLWAGEAGTSLSESLQTDN